MADPAEGLRALASLWERERLAARARSAELRERLSLGERIARGLALKDLELDETDAAPGGRTLLWIKPRGGADLEALRVGPGDPVILWWDDPHGEDALRAVVARRQRERLAVMIDAELPERMDDGGFRLDLDDPEATFDRGARAIQRFAELKRGDPRQALLRVIFGAEPARFGKVVAGEPLDPALHDAQLRAVDRALAAETISLVLGPPGTGKTRTLCELVRRAVRAGERVLVTAASNVAVDNLGERLLEQGVSLVRLGHPARVSSALEPHTLDALVEQTPEHASAKRLLREAAEVRRRARTRFDRQQIGRRELREALSDASRLMRDARAHVSSVQERLLARAAVICATAAGADAKSLGGERFDRVVLDEATQAPDPIALVALSRAPKATLAGDPKQLPPTVLDPDVEREGLGSTFFERLALAADGPPELVTVLDVQHRMHEALMRFPSDAMYGGALVAHESVASHALEDLGVLRDPLRAGPLVFVDSAGKGWTEEKRDEDPSTENPGQAERVAREARRLIGRGVSVSDLAIITPYHAQVLRLRDLLASEARAGLEIGSVDGFQGREKEAVIVDLVRSNDASDIGFLADVRRMNVAITRARRLLIVIGDSATIGNHPFYRAFLDRAEALAAWISAWSDEADPLERAE